jgi:DnaJ-class molecular chaperone
MATLLIIGAVGVVGYLFSLRVHPLRKCPTCNMTGRHFGAVFSGGYRRCRSCGGTGRKDRLGVKVFYGGTDDTGIFPKR